MGSQATLLLDKLHEPLYATPIVSPPEACSMTTPKLGDIGILEYTTGEHYLVVEVLVRPDREDAYYIFSLDSGQQDVLYSEEFESLGWKRVA